MKNLALRCGLALLIAYGAVFGLLAVDAAVRVWIMRTAFETQLDVGFLLVYEGMRVLTVALAVVMSAVLAARARTGTPAALAALLLVLLAVAYAKATTYEAFAGFAQERAARALLAAGTPRSLLQLTFGEPVWAAILAAGALLRLAVTYPRAVTADAILAIGEDDRRGMLRSAAIAGADVGALARTASASALRRGALRPRPVWLAALALSAASVLLEGAGAAAAAFAGIGLPLLLGIPALRASLARSNAAERARILWFVQAALLAGVGFVTGGILSLVPGAAAGWLSFAVLAIVPVVVLLCIATALAPAGSIEPERALRVTAHLGGTAILTVAVFAILDAVLVPAVGGPVATTLALLAAAALGAPGHRLLRAPTARLVPVNSSPT